VTLSQDSQLILIVEDTDHDFDILVRAMRKAGIENDVERCKDGQEALDYLDNEGDDFKKPGFIFLDLNMPNIDGREVLKKIKSDEQLKAIPVAILTSSEKESDIEQCYDLGANTFVPNPMGLNDFVTTVESIKSFWFSAAN